MKKKVGRREFIAGAGQIGLGALAGHLLPVEMLWAREAGAKIPTGPGLDPRLTWTKAPCRFCGVGCGVMVGTKAGKVEAVAGDELSPVNRGLLCIKGYSLPAILYGEDRLLYPQIRSANGKLRRATWNEALDLIAAKYKETLEKHGSNAVAIYGSGQWTISDGYVASKWFRAGIGSNNVEANARLCMSSAVTGFISNFGMDEPMGNYDDLEAADVLVLWGNNMAEMHPVLFSRILESRRQRPSVKVIEMGTRRTPTTDFADQFIGFAPNGDLALANAVAHLIIESGRYDKQFVEKHTVFRRGLEKIGYGLEDNFQFEDTPTPLTFDEYRAWLADYAPEKAAKPSGVPAESIRQLAEYYADPRSVRCGWRRRDVPRDEVRRMMCGG
jgi:nitrate reductase NapA